MSTISLRDSDGISKRIKNTKQDIDDFLTGITNNINIDFHELCGYINIEPCCISITNNQSDKLIQFTISLDISQGLLEFLSTVFIMIDETKLISICFVNSNQINENQLEILNPFQKQFEKQLFSLSIHHIKTNESPLYLDMISWDSLRIVSFKNNNLNDDHCSIICEKLANNPNITALNLDFNKITSKGFIELIDCILDKCKSMLVLSLCYNNIDDQGLDKIQALLQNKNGLNSLKLLRIKYNKFSDENIETFDKELTESTENGNSCNIVI